MLVISDTNILSTFAAGEAFHLLFRLFPNAKIHIPPAVHKELQTGLAYGQRHLETVFQAIDGDKLKMLHLLKKRTTIGSKPAQKIKCRRMRSDSPVKKPERMVAE